MLIIKAFRVRFSLYWFGLANALMDLLGMFGNNQPVSSGCLPANRTFLSLLGMNWNWRN